MTDKAIDILSMSPLELAQWLYEEFMDEIPTSIETVDDMKNASYLLSTLTNKYSYLISMSTVLKIATREEKRKKDNNPDKEETMFEESYHDMIDRKDAVRNMVEVIKMQYKAVSRMITIKEDINKELGMYQ